MSSFHVDARVSVKLEYELAVRLGEFLLGSGTDDKQILALGHKLNNLEEEEESSPPVRFSNIVNNSYRSYKKDWNSNDNNNNNEDNSSNNEEKPRRINLRRRATV